MLKKRMNVHKRVKNWLFTVSLYVLGSQALFAQDNYADLWSTLQVHYPASSKVRLSNEFHWRMTEFVGEPLQLLIRPKVEWKAADHITVTGGYTYIQNWPYRSGQPDLVALEHNLWEDVAFYHPLWNGRLTHAIRLEHRFTSVLFSNSSLGISERDGFAFRNRLRHRITYVEDLSDKVYMRFFNEAFVQMPTGEANSVAQFQQNWVYAGLGWRGIKDFALEAGFHHQYIVRGLERERHLGLWVAINYSIARKVPSKN